MIEPKTPTVTATAVEEPHSSAGRAGPSRSRRRSSHRWLKILLQVGILGGFLLFWEYSSGRLVSSLFISSPSAIAAQLARWISDGSLLFHGLHTFRTGGIGFLVGAVTAIVCGYALGVSKFWADVTEPFITALYSVPKVALIPLLIIWVGIGDGLAITVSALIVFLLLFYNTFFGIREVSPTLINSVRIMGGSWTDVALKVRIPSAFVWIIAGMKISVPQALVGVVTAEILAGNRGLGYLVNFNAGQFNTAGTLGAIIVLLFVGLVLDRLIRLLSHRLLSWQTESYS